MLKNQGIPKSELPLRRGKRPVVRLGGLVKGGLIVLISVFIIFTVVKASTLKITPPSGAPAATFYSLSEIYNFIASSTPATAGDPALDWSTPLEDTGRTLTEIYNALANLISADKVKEGTTYLGVTGSYTGSGFTFGSSSPAGVLTSPATPATGGTFVATNLENYLIATGTAWGVGNVGTLLGRLFNGSAGTLVANYADFPLNNFASLVGATNTVLGFFGGVEDWNNAGTMPVGSYTGGWYGAAGSCNLGNHYCGAGDTAVSADNKDLSTGLVWSIMMDSGTVHTWFWANNCYESGTSPNNSGCKANGNTGCGCIKKPDGSKVGCEALDSSGGNTLGPWRTPTQKELLQAYIDGSRQYLSSPANGFWSATTRSGNTYFGLWVALNSGDMNNGPKTNGTNYKVMCVH